MDWSPNRAFTGPGLTRLTTRQWQIFSVMTPEWKTALQLAADAGLTTSSPEESASKYANQLVKIHFAEKGGTRMQPVWRLSIVFQGLVK